MKPILVEWIDACSVDDWTDVADAKAQELAHMKTLGFLVSEDDKKLTIALSWDSSNDSVSQFLVIPKAWIESRRILKVKL